MKLRCPAIIIIVTLQLMGITNLIYKHYHKSKPIVIERIDQCKSDPNIPIFEKWSNV